MSEADVIDLCRDYVAQISPLELADLPEKCRPGKLVDGNDIAEYAFDLVRHHCDDGTGVNYIAHRLSAFFSGATVRLSQILHRASQAGREDSEQRSA